MKVLVLIILTFSSLLVFSQKKTISFDQKTFEKGTLFYKIKYSNSRKLDRLESTKIGCKIIFFKSVDDKTIEYTDIFHNFDTILDLSTILYSPANNSYNHISLGFNRLYVKKCSADTINQIFEQRKKESEYVKERVKVKKLKDNSSGLSKKDLFKYKNDCLNKMLKKIHTSLNDSIPPDGYKFNLIKQDNENVLLYYSLFNSVELKDDISLYKVGNSVVFENTLIDKSIVELIELGMHYSEIDNYHKAMVIYKTLYLRSGKLEYLNNYKWLHEALLDNEHEK